MNGRERIEKKLNLLTDFLMNHQPPTPLHHCPRGSLLVHSIWRTIQGEGPFVGTPAVFIRLAGCNLQCPLCDTDYTSVSTKMSVQDILDTVEDYGRRTSLVVITGGEPFRQNIKPLMQSLYFSGEGRTVQIETNGTYLVQTGLSLSMRPATERSRIVVVCSPKTPKVPVGSLIDYWKYPIQFGKVDLADGLPTEILGMPKPPARPPDRVLLTQPERIFVVPCDELDEAKNNANLSEATGVAQEFGYRLGVQLHKYIGVD